jgi:hypothetical protein
MNVTPPVPFPHLHTVPAHVGDCTIFDASVLLYQPAVRAAIASEQSAMLETRLAVARWTSGHDVPLTPHAQHAHGEPPHRAAFYVRAQEEFFAWIARGGVWEADGAAAPAITLNPDNTTTS